MIGRNSKLTGVGLVVPPGEDIELDVGLDATTLDVFTATYDDEDVVFPGQPCGKYLRH